MWHQMFRHRRLRCFEGWHGSSRRLHQDQCGGRKQLNSAKFKWIIFHDGLVRIICATTDNIAPTVAQKDLLSGDIARSVMAISSPHHA